MQHFSFEPIIRNNERAIHRTGLKYRIGNPLVVLLIKSFIILVICLSLATISDR